MENKLLASFTDDCWDLDAQKYMIRKEYLLTKLPFNIFIVILLFIYGISELIKGNTSNGLIILFLGLSYILFFVFLYFKNSNKFINEFKVNIKHVNVEFYSQCLVVTQKSTSNNVKTKFEYKEILRLIGKDNYFFVKFRQITLPFNKNTIVYNDSSLDEIIANMNNCIELERERKLKDRKKAQK